MQQSLGWKTVVSERLVYSSDINASKTGTAKFSEIVNKKSIIRNMGRRNTIMILFLIITNSQNYRANARRNKTKSFDFLVLVL